MKRNQLHTTTTRMHTNRCFSSDTKPAPVQTGTGEMLLKDVRIVEAGEAKGHEVWLDKSFVQKTVELAQGRRIKSRLGHTNMCKESLGTYLGYFDNFRYIENGAEAYAVADLHLSSAAKISPNGNLSAYIAELATEAPDMFGNSIEFLPGREFFLNEKGDKVYMGYNWTTDEFIYTKEDGTPYDEKKDGTIITNKTYIEIEQLFASDIVDEPAATSSLFGDTENIPSLLAKVLEVFGMNFSGKKKAIELQRYIKMSKQKLDINATTSDGTPIVVVTENAFIGVGDSVTDADGNAVPDASHEIAESDSGQTGITITTVGGMITKVEATSTSVDTPPAAPLAAEAQNEALAAMTAKTVSLEKELQELKTALSSTTTKLNDLVEKLEKSPVSQALKAIPNTDTETVAGTKTYKSEVFD